VPMQVLRDPQIISGYIYEEPVADFPELTHCGEALCCQGHTLRAHAHEGFEFLYLSRGEASWTVAGRLYPQRKGEMFVAFPGELHATGPRNKGENQHVWIGLRLDRLGAEAERMARHLRRSGTHLLSDCYEAEPLLRAIVGQVVALRPRRAQVIRSLVDSFVSLVGQRLEIAKNPSDAGAHALPYTAVVQRALAYMRQNLDRCLPLADVAAAATARSVPHFCSQFHREVGMTPAAYHRDLRLKAASEALRQPAFDITTVAVQFGFSSSQHFSTLFRRAFGLPPRSWKMGAVRAGPKRGGRG
jgi:AraC-like DNA-binding protein